MDNISHERLTEALREHAAEFLSRESNRASLLTVTRTELDKEGSHATIFFTVYPETMEKQALDFAKRMRSDLYEYVSQKLPHRHIPNLDVAIDRGEKYRQHLDELTKE